MARIGIVEKTLSATALHDFCDRLAKMPKLTLATMQAEAAKLGIELSHSAAGRFKNGTFAAHLEHLKKAKELALEIEAFGGADAGASLADAGATVLMQKVYDALTAKDGVIDFDTFSKIIARLRSGDHSQKALNAKLAEYKRKEAEWRHREKEREKTKKRSLAALQSGGGLSEEALAKIESILGSL